MTPLILLFLSFASISAADDFRITLENGWELSSVDGVRHRCLISRDTNDASITISHNPQRPSENVVILRGKDLSVMEGAWIAIDLIPDGESWVPFWGMAANDAYIFDISDDTFLERFVNAHTLSVTVLPSRSYTFNLPGEQLLSPLSRCVSSLGWVGKDL